MAQRALVTGGAGGLGAVIAATLAAEGMAVVTADLAGGDIDADLSTPAGIDAVIAGAGALDALVNCAGGWSPSGRNYPAASPEEWQAMLTLNLVAPMRLLAHFRPTLSAAVSISSSAARMPGAYEAPEYAVAKAGLIRLTTACADWDVRVSCVVPGWIGLPRAHAEVAALPAGERPELIPPQRIADEVARLLRDPGSAGEVVVIGD